MKVPYCSSWDDWRLLYENFHIDGGIILLTGSHTVTNPQCVLHIIGVFNGKSSTLAHECAYGVRHLSSRRCERWNRIANETFCHLIVEEQKWLFCSGEQKADINRLNSTNAYYQVFFYQEPRNYLFSCWQHRYLSRWRNYHAVHLEAYFTINTTILSCIFTWLFTHNKNSCNARY